MTGVEGAPARRPHIDGWTGWTPGGLADEWINGTPPGDPLPWFTIYCDDETAGAPPGTHKGKDRRKIVRSFARDIAGNWRSMRPLDRIRGTSDQMDPGGMTFFSRDGKNYGYHPEHIGEDAPGWKFKLRCEVCRLGLPKGVRHDTLKPILDALVSAGESEISLGNIVAIVRSRRG